MSISVFPISNSFNIPLNLFVSLYTCKCKHWVDNVLWTIMNSCALMNLESIFSIFFFGIKCLSTWFNILYILSKHGKRKRFIFVISLSKCTLIKRVVVWKPHCITQYFVQNRRHSLQMNIQQCTHIAICKSIGKIMSQMEYMCCCGIALLVKLLNYNFFASWII